MLKALYLDKSDTKQTKDIRKVFSTMGISANIMSLKKDRALTMRKKRRNEKTSPCERFEKNINLQEKAKNFNFKYDAEEETRRAASTIEKSLFPLSNEGGFQDSVERLKTDDSVDLRQLTKEDVASQRERRETTQENLADQEQDTVHITEQQQELINNSPKSAKSPVSPLKIDEPEEDKLKSRRETTNSFEEEWYLIESQDLVNESLVMICNKRIDE